MVLPDVAQGDPHAAAHNNERAQINQNQADIDDLSAASTAMAAQLALRAPIDSPTLTGDPKAPTPAVADNDTSIATTAFVKQQGYAPLASPALTGTPTAPTPAAATNTTQIATTAFVKQQGYVDLSTLYALQVKAYVTVVSIANVALTGLQTIDGVTLVAGSRVLLVGQTSPAENGIWVAAAGAWTRPTDFDSATETNGAVVSVAFGGTYTGTRWTTKGVGGGALGVAAQQWYRVLDSSYLGTGSGQIALLNAQGRYDIARIASGVPDGTKFVRDDGTLAVPPGGGGGGSGDVVGPAVAVNDNLVAFSGTSGKLVKDSGVAISSLALLASPTFTGDPKAPTASVSDDDTTIATTAFVKDAIQGSAVALGSITGAVSLSASLTASTAVNAVVTATLTGNTTFTAATMPVVAAGTQFVVKFTQDATGSRTLTLTNILKPGGSLVLSTAAGAVDYVVFFYDGTSWSANLTGKGYAA